MKSIRGRLMATLAASLTAILAAGGAGVYFLTRAALRADFDAMLRSALATDVERTVRGAVIEGPGRRHVFKPGVDRDPPLYFEVWTLNGRLVGRSESLRGRDLDFPLQGRRSGADNITLPNGRPGRGMDVQNTIAAEKEFSERLAKEQKEATARLLTGTPQAAGKAPANGELERPPRAAPVVAAIVIAADSSGLESVLGRLSWVLWTFGLLVLLVAVAVAAFVSRRGLAPLRQVADQAERMGAANLSLRFPAKDLPSELAMICQRLNDLIARLDAAFARERNFTADVAHELRTPISELRSLAEVALKYPGPDAEANEAFRDALEIAVQMQGVVNGLLSIARCEAGSQIMARERVDVAGLAASVWKRRKPRAAHRGLRFELLANEPVLIDTDPGMVGVILSNLVSNAVDYAPPGSLVRLRLETDGGGFVLAVINTANNIDATDLDRMFERFWRKDPVRSSGEHSGIGLSIARAYAQVLGLGLTASLGPERLLEMRLSGPVTSSDGGVPAPGSVRNGAAEFV